VANPIKAKKKIQSSNGAGQSPGNLLWLFELVLVVATVALYLPVHGYPFVNYDDDVYITYNDHVKSGLSWDTVQWAFTSYDDSNWHPLTWLSHAADYQMFQVDAGGHHETNLLLHVLNVLLLFYVLWLATGFVGRSFFVAGLFALHPVNVESVVWIAERKNLLSMLFFLLALGAYRWYVRKPRVARYFVVALLFALGLMAKPQVITFPLVLLLWDYWPLRRMFAEEPRVPPQEAARGVLPRSFRYLVVEKLPLFVLSAASAVMTIKAQHYAGAMSGVHWQPLTIRLENAIVAYAQYVGKAFWPAWLALVYPHPGASIQAWQVVASLLFLLIITALVVANRRRRYLLFGWLWFLGTLVPMIGVIQVGVQAMADRYAYLSFIGLFVMVGWGLSELAQQRRVSLSWQAGFCTAVLLVLFAVARIQIGYWSDNVTLWTHVLKVTSVNWVAENNIGHALLNEEREDDAVGHFRTAVAINPSDADSTLNIGAYEQQHGDLPGAIEQYNKTISITKDKIRLNVPVRDQAFRNMARAYLSLGNYPLARESFQQAVDLNPKDGEAWIGVGVMAQKFGQADVAVQAYNRALAIQPFDLGYVLLAKALEQAGRTAEAQTAMQKGQQLSGNFETTQRVAERLLAQ
jgi:tetratricopeptide (TPR) repeat protein